VLISQPNVSINSWILISKSKDGLIERFQNFLDIAVCTWPLIEIKFIIENVGTEKLADFHTFIEQIDEVMQEKI
jgi:hypothetical protein